MLGQTDDLVSRIKQVAAQIEGRIAFSTSLGLYPCSKRAVTSEPNEGSHRCVND
jgi:hypothetical protein